MPGGAIPNAGKSARKASAHADGFIGMKKGNIEVAHLGIVAGNKELPATAAKWAKANKIPLSIAGLAGCADADALRRIAGADGYLGVNISEITGTIGWFKSRGVDTVVMLGGVGGCRPRLTLDLLRIAARLLFMRRRYDGVLRLVIERFERAGFRVAGVTDLVPELLIGHGVQGDVMPSSSDIAEVSACWGLAEEFARTDRGQSAIALGGRLVALEDFAGTDALIARASKLKGKRRGGVLLKLLKPGQDARADMPVIGEDTVRNLAAGGFSGVAVEAGKTIIQGDRRRVIGLADRMGIFILGYRPKR